MDGFSLVAIHFSIGPGNRHQGMQSEGGQALALEGVFLRRGQADHVNRVEGSAEHPRILDPGRIWDPEE